MCVCVSKRNRFGRHSIKDSKTAEGVLPFLTDDRYASPRVKPQLTDLGLLVYFT